MTEQKKTTQTRQFKCRFAHPTFTGKYKCIVNGLDDESITIVSQETCENCDRYKSRYIEYPISVNKIENHKITTEGLGHKCGALCVIKPCDEKCHGKSYIGIYIGDLPTNIITSFDEEQGILTNRTMNNPAIFVPELKKIVYGCESWWKEIESPDDFKEITTEDVENQWYMKLLKSWK